jgi:hypothetical protein
MEGVNSTMIHCKNFCKCHHVPPQCKNNEKKKKRAYLPPHKRVRSLFFLNNLYCYINIRFCLIKKLSLIVFNQLSFLILVFKLLGNCSKTKGILRNAEPCVFSHWTQCLNHLGAIALFGTWNEVTFLPGGVESM